MLKVSPAADVAGCMQLSRVVTVTEHGGERGQAAQN
jgi:hypothetical protein